MPAHRGSEADKEVIGRRGRYREVAPNLKVKEVTVGDGERRRRYAVCFNPREAERRLAHRRQVLEELEAELATLSGLADGERHRHRVRGGRVRTPLFYLRKKPILVSMNRRTRI